MAGSLAVCEWCGASFQKPRPSSNSRFCSREHYQAWWRENVQGRASRNGARVLAELHAEGRDPRLNEKAQRARSRAAKQSNRKDPRLAKLPPERRQEIAKNAANARTNANSASRRTTEN